jgi:hypothetical protein
MEPKGLKRLIFNLSIDQFMRGQQIWVCQLQKSRASVSGNIYLMTLEAVIAPTLSVKDVVRKI